MFLKNLHIYFHSGYTNLHIYNRIWGYTFSQVYLSEVIFYFLADKHYDTIRWKLNVILIYFLCSHKYWRFSYSYLPFLLNYNLFSHDEETMPFVVSKTNQFWKNICDIQVYIVHVCVCACVRGCVFVYVCGLEDGSVIKHLPQKTRGLGFAFSAPVWQPTCDPGASRHRCVPYCKLASQTSWIIGLCACLGGEWE